MKTTLLHFSLELLNIQETEMASSLLSTGHTVLTLCERSTVLIPGEVVFIVNRQLHILVLMLLSANI